MIRQALRRNPWAFLGPAATQALAAALVTTGLCLLASFDGAPLDPAQRAALTASGIADLGIIFLASSIYLSLLIVGVTMGTAIADQAEDLALVRTIGATPGRVRRTIAAQAALVALPATAAGIPLGLLAGYAWLHALTGHGVVPAEVGFRMHGGTVPIAFAVTVGTSLVGALIAAIRPSRLRPAVALTEAAVPRRRSGRVRTPVGLILVAGGIAWPRCSPARTRRRPIRPGSSSCWPCAWAWECSARSCCGSRRRWPGWPARPARSRPTPSSRGPVRCPELSSRSPSRSPSPGSPPPWVRPPRGHRHRRPAADRWLEYSGTGAYTAFAAIAAANTLVTAIQARRRDLAVIRLAGGTRGRTLAVVICEALVVTGTALVAGAVVATTTLLPLLHTALGTWRPWLPACWLVGGIATTAALVSPEWCCRPRSLRRAPIEVIG